MLCVKVAIERVIHNDIAIARNLSMDHLELATRVNISLASFLAGGQITGYDYNVDPKNINIGISTSPTASPVNNLNGIRWDHKLIPAFPHAATPVVAKPFPTTPSIPVDVGTDTVVPEELSDEDRYDAVKKLFV